MGLHAGPARGCPGDGAGLGGADRCADGRVREAEVAGEGQGCPADEALVVTEWWVVDVVVGVVAVCGVREEKAEEEVEVETTTST